MLVLSRRAKGKISFPEAGISIHFIRVQSGTAMVGIDAPMHIKIVCDEVDGGADQTEETTPKELQQLPRHIRHSIRNELHTLSVGMHLFKEQLHLGLEEDSHQTFEVLMSSIRTLAANDFLKRPEPGRSADAPAKRRAILVVEDLVNEREILASFLRHHGYDVSTAADGDEALEFLACHDSPDVLLLNITNEASTVREIRGDVRHEQTRVYAISDLSPEDSGLETGRRGVDCWFRKPLDVELLFEALASEQVDQLHS